MFSSRILSHIICFVQLYSKTCKNHSFGTIKPSLNHSKSLGKGSHKDKQASMWTIKTRQGGRCWTDFSIWSLPTFWQKKSLLPCYFTFTSHTFFLISVAIDLCQYKLQNWFNSTGRDDELTIMHVHILQASWSIPVTTLQLWVAAWKKKEISLHRAEHLQPAGMDSPGGLEDSYILRRMEQGCLLSVNPLRKPRAGHGGATLKAAN